AHPLGYARVAGDTASLPSPMAMYSIYSGIDQLGIVGTVAPGIFAQPDGAGDSSTRNPQARRATVWPPSPGGVVTDTPLGGSPSGRARGTLASW
ncbi:MAG: hypothetical protein ACLQRH_04140, partial [Acidimicrobiales bacterium]